MLFWQRFVGVGGGGDGAGVGAAEVVAEVVVWASVVVVVLGESTGCHGTC